MNSCDRLKEMSMRAHLEVESKLYQATEDRKAPRRNHFRFAKNIGADQDEECRLRIAGSVAAGNRIAADALNVQRSTGL